MNAIQQHLQNEVKLTLLSSFRRKNLFREIGFTVRIIITYQASGEPEIEK